MFADRTAPHAVRVTAPSRLHITLLDVGHATQRQYGGIGLVIDRPGVVVLATPSIGRSVTGIPGDYVSAVDFMIASLEATLRTALNGEVTVQAFPEPHIGLGAKTSTLLSVGRALTALNGVPVTPQELWRASGRGGTSGIGVHAFYRGGLLVDGGHRPLVPRRFEPSSFGRPICAPPLLVAMPVPDSWRATLVLPTGSRVFGEAERSVFAQAPVADTDTFRALSAVFPGLVAAVATDDLDAARTALSTIMSSGFKRLEVANQTANVRGLAQELSESTGMPVGMSSMGPLLYVLHRADDGNQEKVSACADAWGASTLVTCSPAVQGHRLEMSLDLSGASGWVRKGAAADAG